MKTLVTGWPTSMRSSARAEDLQSEPPPPPRRRGRPREPLSPEMSEILARYMSGARPIEIATALGLTRRRVDWSLQALRRRGAIDADVRVTRRPAEPRCALSLSVTDDERAAIRAAVAASTFPTTINDWCRAALRRAAGLDTNP